jgi:hypothetical protein
MAASSRYPTALCRRYGISRNAGYSWLDSYKHHGP